MTRPPEWNEAKRAIQDFARHLADELMKFPPGDEEKAQEYFFLRMHEWRKKLIDGGLETREANIIVSGASVMVSAAIEADMQRAMH